MVYRNLTNSHSSIGGNGSTLGGDENEYKILLENLKGRNCLGDISLFWKII
jgi:hypothetical protein